MTDSSNLDLVRSIYAAHERGDYSSVEWAHSDIELVVVDGPSRTSDSGRRATRRDRLVEPRPRALDLR